MDWKLFLSMLAKVASMYISCFGWVGVGAVFLQNWHKLFYKLEYPYWTLVSVYRFLAPARKLVWVVFVSTAAITEDKLGWAFYLSSVFTFVICFVWKDNFGDDDRKKKPSKVKAFIKSIGYKLVVVPSHG